MKIECVYIVNWPDGSWYVGQTTDYDQRVRRHKSDFRLGKARLLMQRAFDRNGKVNPEFSILEVESNLAKRKEMEEAFIDFNMGDPELCCNQHHAKNHQKSTTECDSIKTRMQLIVEIAGLSERINILTNRLSELEDE